MTRTRTRHPHPVIGFTAFIGAGKDAAAEALVADGWSQAIFKQYLIDAMVALDQIVLVYESDGRPVEIPGDGVILPVLRDPTDYFVARRMSDYVAEYGYEVAKRHPEVRRAMLRTGTEGGRDIHGQDCWVNLTMANLPDTPVVITDVRFPNEAQAIREVGGKVVRIVRPGVGRTVAHSSEDFAEFGSVDDTLVNDGSLEDLHAAVRRLAQAASW